MNVCMCEFVFGRDCICRKIDSAVELMAAEDDFVLVEQVKGYKQV